MSGKSVRIDEFTFIVISYNHAQYIQDHLCSIRDILHNYGNGISVDIVIADDCSRDNTREIVDEWLNNNRSLFRSIIRQYANENRGVVRNLLGAINVVKTRHFKFLAGDDKYMVEDIFSIFSEVNLSQIIVTPVVPYGGMTNTVEMIRRFRCLLYSAKKNKVQQLMKYDNYIPAPGVFLDGDLLRDNTLQKYLLRFRNIEDYPMWYYFLYTKMLDVRVVSKPFVFYRVSSGVSTQEKHEKRGMFVSELNRMEIELHVRRHRRPKYLNIYNYFAKINRIILASRREKIDSLIGDNEWLSLYK